MDFENVLMTRAALAWKGDLNLSLFTLQLSVVMESNMLIFCCSLCVSNIKNTQSRKFLETIQICLKLHPNKRNINITESSHTMVIRTVPLAPRGPSRKAVHSESCWQERTTVSKRREKV